MSERLLQATSDLLELCGAAVERSGPVDLELLAPPAVQSVLGIDEHERLHFSERAPEGARRVGFDAEWFGRFETLLDGRGRRRRVALVANTPRVSRPAEALERALDLRNATWRLAGVQPAVAHVLALRFAYTAASDDRRVGLLDLGVNLHTRSTLGDLLPALLASVAHGASDAALPPAEGPPGPESVAAMLEAALAPRVEDALAPFLAGMRRRMERDRARLQTYYQQLLDESADRSARARRGQASDAGRVALEREEQRRAAIRADYEAKVADLATKYALEVDVRLVQVLEVAVPVQRFRVRVLRRKLSREIALDLFPFASRLEPPPCEASFSSDRVRLACDDAVHIVAPAGLAPCPRCERSYCRACNPRACPRCRS
jgi:hypothetical protein